MKVIHQEEGVSGAASVMTTGLRAIERRKILASKTKARFSASHAAPKPSRNRKPLPPCGQHFVREAIGEKCDQRPSSWNRIDRSRSRQMKPQHSTVVMAPAIVQVQNDRQ